MNRSQLESVVAARASLSGSDAASAVRAMLETIGEVLTAGETVTIAGFGTFTTSDRAPRKGRSPRTAKSSPSPPRAPRRSCRPVPCAGPSTATLLDAWNVIPRQAPQKMLHTSKDAAGRATLACATFGEERKRGDFFNPSNVRTYA